MSATLPSRRLGKSTLSQYLRSQCDKQLYLSLFGNRPDVLTKAGLPLPLKTRPNVAIVTKSGREFELEQFDNLQRAIPDHVVCESGFQEIKLEDALPKIKTLPTFILQPIFHPQQFREPALTNLGLDKNEIALIPELYGLIPDALLIRESSSNDFEVLPSGKRVRINPGEKRHAISVIDLKNVTEANSSYAAEVCLYAFFLSNWLATNGKAFSANYYVSDKVYLWKHVEMPHFHNVLTLKSAATSQKRIEALLIDLEDGLVDFMLFMPSVRKFFKEDVPRVVSKGDTDGWKTVPYHVNSKCGACDWLGNKEWLFGDSLKHYNTHAEDYCLQAADTSDHLSQMSGLSKGATQILSGDGHSEVKQLVGIQAASPVLRKHTLLKKDRSQIGERARAIKTGDLTTDGAARIAGFAKNFNIEFEIIVNFDSGAGLLTGIAFRGIAFPPFGETFTVDGESKTFITIKEEAVVVGKDLMDTEWVALEEFIQKFAKAASDIQKIFTDNGWGNVATQICFWEARQYDELCNAFGRHLIKVLGLPEKTERALAWLFPSEELMEKDEQIAPGIIFIKDIVDLSLRLPVKFASTLLGAAEAYHHPNMTPRKVDTYYRERLGNAIPRERIFEIWKSSTNTIKMYGKQISLMEAMKKYMEVLKAHTWALASITARLRQDFKGQISGKAPALNLSIPRGANRLAYDSKLWMQWDYVETATAQNERKANLVTKVERLEASYQAILMPRLISDLGNHRYEFEVSEDSTEAKLEEGNAYYVLGFVNNASFPLESPYSLGITSSSNPGDLYTPLHKLIAVSLESFDRVERRAIIQIRPRWSALQSIFDELFSRDLIHIERESIFITEGMAYDDTANTRRILDSIGNPSNSKIAKESLAAMGAGRNKVSQGTDAITPAASVLWDADKLAKQPVRSDQEVEIIFKYVKKVAPYLNQSQEKAIAHAVKYQLSIVWGPPGTGKTNTLAALIHGLVYEGQNVNKARKILLSGPNYRTAEELSDRVLQSLNKDPGCKVDIFWVYSRSRTLRPASQVNDHVNLISLQPKINNPDEDTQALIDSLNNPDVVTIVSTTAHNILNYLSPLSSADDNGSLKEIFDVVVIDECSQVPVTMALRPFAVLKESGQLIIAGDHLQMPPIASLEAPTNAEYLVGSIQTYLLKRFDIKPQELLINYRSNQDLVDFAKTLNYPALLEAYNKDRSLHLIKKLDDVIASLPPGLPRTDAYRQILSPDRRVTALIHDDIVSSQANEVEAKVVAGLAYCLRHSMSSSMAPQAQGFVFKPYTDDDFFRLGLGVVTPHKAQKALVIKELRTLFPGVSGELIFDAVDTVERFQGGERQSIIVSFGVGDLDIIEGEEEFLLQMERTNVAVSRAQAKCIVLMPKALAYHLPTDEKARKTSVAIKSYIEEFCSNRIGVELDFNGQRRSAEIRWH
ncbi:MAG: DNA helicase [Bacteroidetes bacterium]|nr:MAG: DNA helicase [Bacteroidota bacterium]REK05179.1 MAG: DNA helicase [Bacteroidota bacterium]REK32584.1 MAG: DNA helicase [Bacteroidota bacterium]REK48969.1 MAG: DNA helicase [Bacteroidota bacterium]